MLFLFGKENVDQHKRLFLTLEEKDIRWHNRRDNKGIFSDTIQTYRRLLYLNEHSLITESLEDWISLIKN